MELMIKILLALMLIMVFSGCPGCISIPGLSGNSFDVIKAELSIPIQPKTAIIIPLFGEVSEKWAVDVEKALRNSRCSLVVLWIESPGGGVTETKILTHKLQALQEKYNKQIYVYSERILASGAYWVASTFNKIIISPAGHTGSIGVYMVRVDYSGLYDMLGLKYHYIASDSTKVMGNNSTPMKDWERGYWQWVIDLTHRAFMNHVWVHRSTQLINSYKFRNWAAVKTAQDTLQVANQFRQIANGLLYNAEYAMSFGLIDGVMYFDDFVGALREDGYEVITIKGKVIDDFYPSNDETKTEQKALNYLQAGVL